MQEDYEKRREDMDCNIDNTDHKTGQGIATKGLQIRILQK